MKTRTPTSAFVLVCDTSSATQAGPARTDAAGQPVQRFVKDIARAGSIVRRTDGSSMTIDGPWLQARAEEFGRMKTNGGRVPVPAGHTFDPEKNRGWVEDMWVDGDRLVASIDLIGDGIRLAGTNQVSIYAKPNHTDDNGETYAFPILHVALVPDPQVSGLGEWVPIAASSSSTPQSVPVFRLAQETPMDALKQIAAKLGLTVPDDADEAAVLKMIMDKLGPMSEAAAGAQQAQTALAASKSALDALKAKYEPATPDPMLVKLAGQNRALRLSQLLDAGKISKACHDGLHGRFVGKDNAAAALTLSQSADDMFDGIVEALNQNPALVGKGKTGPQGGSIALNRETPGEAPSAQNDPDIEKRVKAAYGKR